MYAAGRKGVKHGHFRGWDATGFPRASHAAIHSAAPSIGRRSEDAMNPFLWLVHAVITLYIWILIAAAVLSWLVAFNVVNRYNPTVRIIGDTLFRLTEPLLRPIRNVLPSLGGLDISPVILILALLFLERVIFWIFA